MKTVLLLVLMSHSVFSEKHSVKFFFAGFSGIKDFPDYSVATEMDGIEVFNHNSNKTLKKDLNMVKALRQIDPELVDWIEQYFKILPFIFETMDNNMMQNFPKTKEQHSQKVSPDGFSGIPDFSDVSETLKMDGFEDIDDNINKLLKKYQHRIISVFRTCSDLEHFIDSMYSEILPDISKDMINILMQIFNQAGGVHIFQTIAECKQDETGKVAVSVKYGFDGEDDMSIDFQNLTITFYKPEPSTEKLRLDYPLEYVKDALTLVCSKTLDVTKHTQPRTVLPSVSLLQKSPSSPITCFATGFFPDRAVLFWRKDGEELFEDVEHGEILPNQDGSFQMSVELLKLPSEDWGKYECVFLLSGVKEDMVTNLEKSVIRTNHAPEYRSEL